MKEKKKKLSRIPTINRRLFSLWSEVVRARAGNKCEFCGLEVGSTYNDKIVLKLDAHHLLSRKIKDNPIKWDIRNAVCVCAFCHKFGIPSFHKDAITTVTWLQKNRPDRYEFVLNNNKLAIDLKNRDILAEIEERLNNSEPLNIEKLQQMDADAKKKEVPKEKPKGNLFEDAP